MLKYLNIENDLLLLAALKLGDEIAFKNIYNNYWLTLFNSAYSHIKDKEKCQDIIQNVFTDLWNRRTELEIQNLQAFLYTAVRFQALKAIHQNARQTYFVDAFDTKIISSLKTDEVLLEKEAKNIVELFIKALPEKRRHIFLLHYFDELSTADIAGRLNVSQKTVQNQLTTASHALRLRLTQLFSYTFFITSFFIR